MEHELAQINKYYNLNAKIGDKILFQKKAKGGIVGVRGGYFMILLEGESKPCLYHPTWELEIQR